MTSVSDPLTVMFPALAHKANAANATTPILLINFIVQFCFPGAHSAHVISLLIACYGGASGMLRFGYGNPEDWIPVDLRRSDCAGPDKPARPPAESAAAATKGETRMNARKVPERSPRPKALRLWHGSSHSFHRGRKPDRPRHLSPHSSPLALHPPNCGRSNLAKACNSPAALALNPPRKIPSPERLLPAKSRVCHPPVARPADALPAAANLDTASPNLDHPCPPTLSAHRGNLVPAWAPNRIHPGLHLRPDPRLRSKRSRTGDLQCSTLPPAHPRKGHCPWRRASRPSRSGPSCRRARSC